MFERFSAGLHARLFFTTSLLSLLGVSALIGILGLSGCDSSVRDSGANEAVVGAESTKAANTSRPNILLIVVDDMGFTDLGSFGGEIPTPNLDALAEAGTRFTDFQVLPACSPTRATLLTGREPHAVGFGSLAEELAENQQGQSAYAGELPVDVTTLPRLLQFAGYKTYMAGKWHLGYEGGRGPAFFGFDRSVALIAGGASHFPDMKPAYAPDPNAIASYTVDDQVMSVAPAHFKYSSQFYADELISYISGGENEGVNESANEGDGDGDGDASGEGVNNSSAEAPFFAYLSFTAPHWPLQAPDEAIARFANDYTGGYEQLRELRLARLKDLGVIPESASLSELPPKVRPWDSLTSEERVRESRAMAVYAAMISEIDQNVGKLVDHLKATGQFDNTLVVFLSDNGPEGHDLDETWPADLFPKIRAVIDERFDHSTEQMGRPGSYTLYGAGWAHAGSPHLRLYKGFPTEGGTRVAAFMKLPGGASQVPWVRQRVSVRDVMPTLLELARVPVPDSIEQSFAGQSIASLTMDESAVIAGPDPIAIEFLGKQAVRQGSWKLVKLPPPYGTGAFTLYNVESDLAEAHDLSAEQPQKLAELTALYNAYVERYGVIQPDWVSGY